MSSTEPGNQTNLRKIPFTFSMAICIPPDIFGMKWPVLAVERTADC
jgi:hypothetical protein